MSAVTTARTNAAFGVAVATVETLHPSERAVLELEHSKPALDALAAALAPFAGAFDAIGRAFDGSAGVMAAIGVRVVMIAMIRFPRLIAAAACALAARTMETERKRAAFARARSRGESNAGDELMALGPRAEARAITMKEATGAMARAADVGERLASVAEWRSRTVSAATMYAAYAMCGLSAFVRAEVMMCWIALYVTRPARLRVVPDPVASCWSRLPHLGKEANKIQ